jgi:hypothetical protein
LKKILFCRHGGKFLEVWQYFPPVAFSAMPAEIFSNHVVAYTDKKNYNNFTIIIVKFEITIH